MKEKWIIILIVIALLIVIPLAVKLLPFYATIIAGISFLVGLLGGYSIKSLYDKYIK